MAASDYAYYDHEKQERGYWINEGSTWVTIYSKDFGNGTR